MNEDRVLVTKHGHFEIGSWNGKNESGIEPVCDKVVVRVDRAMEKSRGGVLLTQEGAERQTLSATTGVLVAVGPQAFAWDTDRAHRWEGEKPKPGTRVCFQRYAGQEYDGLDGELYRVMQDRSIAGTQGEAPAESAVTSRDSIITGSGSTVLGEAAAA